MKQRSHETSDGYTRSEAAPEEHTFRVLQSMELSYPRKGRVTRCTFALKCKGAKLDHRMQYVRILSINGSGPHIDRGCVPCARIVLLSHLARLAKFQGYLVDTLNAVNAAEYFKSRITTGTPGYTPQGVTVHYEPKPHPKIAGNLVDEEE